MFLNTGRSEVEGFFELLPSSLPFLPSSFFFCQVRGVSAKFGTNSTEFLPSFLPFCQGSWHRVGKKLPMVSCWQFFANSEPLSTKSTNSIMGVCNGSELAIFANSFELAESTKLGRSETRKRKWGKPLVPRGTKEFIPPPPPARARRL